MDSTLVDDICRSVISYKGPSGASWTLDEADECLNLVITALSGDCDDDGDDDDSDDDDGDSVANRDIAQFERDLLRASEALFHLKYFCSHECSGEHDTHDVDPDFLICHVMNKMISTQLMKIPSQTRPCFLSLWVIL